MIEICFSEEEQKQTLWQKWMRRYNRKKQKCREYYREFLDEELLVMELACTYERAAQFGREWFEQCVVRVKQLYPRQLIYFSEEVCRKYRLEEYRKKWICWYCLFPLLWKQVVGLYGIREQEIEVVLVDTGDFLAFYLCEELAKRIRRMEIITSRPKVWQQCVDCHLEEWGLAIELVNHLPEWQEQKIFVDLYGTYIKRFANLAQNNVILAWEINGSQKEFLRDRIRGGRIVTGYTQSLCGKVVEKRLASIFMQSHNWKLRQMADAREISIKTKDLEEIRRQYKWEVAALEKL